MTISINIYPKKRVWRWGSGVINDVRWWAWDWVANAHPSISINSTYTVSEGRQIINCWSRMYPEQYIFGRQKHLFWYCPAWWRPTLSFLIRRPDFRLQIDVGAEHIWAPAAVTSPSSGGLKTYFSFETQKKTLTFLSHSHSQASLLKTITSHLSKCGQFLATLVALHFTPVSEWASDSFGLA